MKAVLRYALVTVFLFATAVIVVVFNTHRPRMLIVHSASSQTPSILGINRGLRDQLRNKNFLNVRWYYSGLNNNSMSPAEDAGLPARRLIDSWQPNVIVVVGDEAQMYVTRHYINHPNIRFVYCAVNNDIAPYGLDHAKNAGGFLTIPPIRAISTMLQDFAKQIGQEEPIRVLHMGDQSEGVTDDARYMSTYPWAPLRFVGNSLVDNFDDWQARVVSAKGQVHYILVSDYRALMRSRTDRQLVPPTEVVAWTLNHSPVPVIGTTNQFVQDGGGLALFPASYEQGSAAGKMAIDMLENASASLVMKPRILSDFTLAMRASTLSGYGLTLPEIYLALAKSTNNYFP